MGEKANYFQWIFVIIVKDIFFYVFSLNQGSAILWVSSLQHTWPLRKALPSHPHPREDADHWALPTYALLEHKRLVPHGPSALLFFSSLARMFSVQGTRERATAVRSLGLCSITWLCQVPWQCCRWWVTFYWHPYPDLLSLRARLEVLTLGLLY